MEQLDGLYQVIIDHREVFNNLETPPRILNDIEIDHQTRAGREMLLQHLTMTLVGDTLPNVPSCALGHISGESRLGEICDRCNTRVSHVVDRHLDGCFWLAPPKGIKSFIHPEIWSCLNRALSPEKKIKIMLWMTDPNCRDLPTKHLDWYEGYTARFRRTMTFFEDNFDEIMEYVLQAPWMNDTERVRQAFEFIVVNREFVFQPYLPVPASIFMVSERSSRGSLADDITPALLDAIFTVTSTYTSPIPLNRRSLESHAARGSAALAECYFDINTSYIGGKPGLIRRQWIGSRQFFTGRAVVTSINGTYHHEEVHIPWAMAINLFEPHLVNLLMHKGYLEDEALAYLEDHTLCDDEQGTMRQMFDTLLNLCDPIPGWEVKKMPVGAIEDSIAGGSIPDVFPMGVFKDLDERMVDMNPMRGYPVLVHRPPTLTRLSMQCLYITRIKGPEDWSLSIPDSGYKGWNSDRKTSHNCFGNGGRFGLSTGKPVDDNFFNCLEPT